MNLLCISTSGPTASAALLHKGGALESLSDSSGRTHCETVMILAEALLAKNGLNVQDIDTFAADAGPGSFTGVRIGVCSVNALGAAAGKPVIAVSSLEALYYSLTAPKGTVCALIDARNGNGYAALIKDGEYLLEPEAVSVADFIKCLPAGVTFVGNGAEAYREMILNAAAYPAFAPGPDNGALAGGAALGALKKLLSGGASERILPLYLRPSQAERVYEQKKGANV